jgi:hypothetical protein
LKELEKPESIDELKMIIKEVSKSIKPNMVHHAIWNLMKELNFALKKEMDISSLPWIDII